MQLGRRPRTPFPAEYKGLQLIRTHGRVFGAPSFVEAERALHTGELLTHPAVVSAATLGEVEALIDGLGGGPAAPEPRGEHRGYRLYGYGGVTYAIPPDTGDVDLTFPDERRRAGVLAAATPDDLVALLDRLAEATPVEFAGWLPVFERSGNCGAHPQFAHAGEAPPGYRFVRSAPPPGTKPPLWRRAMGKLAAWKDRLTHAVCSAAQPLLAVFRAVPGVGLRERVRTLGALARLGVRLVRKGCDVRATARFLLSRHLQSQMLLSRAGGLTFLTSMPYTFNQGPWVLEIEDPTTLFYPLIQNGNTCGLDFRASPYFPVVKALLESDECRGIVTHMRSTARLVPALFQSDIIRNKVSHRPLGVRLPAKSQKHDDRADDEVHLLFINSWCQVPENFFVRGGLDVLEAFAVLRTRYPQLRLTLRTALPALAHHYHHILESGWVRVINRFLSAEEMAELHANSHIFLLPAARVHIVSLLQAMSYGLAVVGSDGWGMQEYLRDGHNGLVVKGRYGKASWADEDAGVLREDYEPMYTADPAVVAGIVEAVSRLVEDRELRARIGRNARADVETKYTTAQWNQGLKEVFDRATAGGTHAR